MGMANASRRACSTAHFVDALVILTLTLPLRLPLTLIALLLQVKLTPFATRLVTDMAYLRSARGAPPESPKAAEPEFEHKPGSVTFPYEELKGRHHALCLAASTCADSGGFAGCLAGWIQTADYESL